MSMQTATPVPPPADPATAEYSGEIRFGVVMYGGVSLAIYINGVANELFEMACATPRFGVTIERDKESCTREIYRRLSWLIGNADLRAQYAQRIAAGARPPAPAGQFDAGPADAWGQVDTASYSQIRLVVDVISGTSAGGINGVFLAKALANGEQFGVLKDLWVNEGDIGLLLNDKRSYGGMVPELVNRSDKPNSLLNSDRMYKKLYDAMGAMPALKVASWPPGKRGSPLVEEVDLFITTTDIEGSAVPLRLFDKVVYERRYKQNFRFSYPNGVTESGNDFDAVNNPFLAFASRCTSSFPFAFEPMTLAALTRLKIDGGPPGVGRWKAFFANLPRIEMQQNAHEYRAFGDGGYLDNKPFTYVVETLSQRFSSVPMERKLVFVEPSPKQIDPLRLPDPLNPPDALENSLAALTGIPRYETIREDLQSVLQRNRRIERVERLVRAGEIDMENQAGANPFHKALRAGGTLPAWSSLKLSEMVDYYSVAYLPYQRLRNFAVTDALADRLGLRWGIDRESDLQYGLRALVRVWRERNFHDEGDGGRETTNAFLDQFDFDYRLRRLGFLLRKIDQLTRLWHKRCAGPLDTSPGTASKPAFLSEVERQMVEHLPEPYRMLPATLNKHQLQDGLRVLGSLKAGLIDVRGALLAARHASDILAGNAAALDLTLSAELKEVLHLVLGKASAGELKLSAADSAEPVPVALDPDALRLASISRTLQEGVLFRANALFAAAANGQRTRLQEALELDLEAMSVKRSARRPQEAKPPMEGISERAWILLGKPEFDPLSIPPVKVHAAPDTSRADAHAAGPLHDLNAEAACVLRQFLGDYYLRFDSFDQMSFPLYYDTGTGEPSTVEVVRISPVDATNLIDEASDSLHRRKLAGTALANFGAFLDRRWRLNDNMWGRLDGAERLIQALLPMSDDDTEVVRRELIERAHQYILREALVPEGNEDLADLVLKALDDVPGSGNTSERLKALLAQLWTGNPVARGRLGAVLTSLLSERGLMDYVRGAREVDREPDPKATLESAARAVTIAGRVLEGISAKSGNGSRVSRWLARLGLMLQGIVAVSVPGALKHRWWTHGVQVLYAFEVFAIFVAILFGSPDMRELALTAFGVTLGVHLLTLIAGDVMRERKRWLRLTMIILLASLIGLAALGALTLYQQAQRQQLCWTRPGIVAEKGLAGRVCGWLGGRAPAEPNKLWQAQGKVFGAIARQLSRLATRHEDRYGEGDSRAHAALTIPVAWPGKSQFDALSGP